MVSGQEHTAPGKVSSDLPVTRLDNITALAYTRATGGAAPPHGYPGVGACVDEGNEVPHTPRLECCMRAYRVEKIVSQDGVLELQALPFRAGEVVEVIILSREDKMHEAQYLPLKGKVLRYEKPTEPVAQDDWEVLQ
jgi:hypothetical protein